MTREEAIKIVKENMHLSYDDGNTFEALKTLVPELRESEDERIRKEIIDFLTDGIWDTTIIDKVKLSQRYAKWISYLTKQKEDYSDFLEEDKKYMEKYIPLDKTTLVKLLAERDRNIDESLESFEKQKEPTEELSIRLNGLMQEYVKAGKDEEEQEHRLKCYQLFWDALGDSEFFKQKEQKSAEKLSKEDYVKKFKALCDAYEIKLPNREYDIYHLCNDLSKLSIDSGKQKPEWSDEDEKMLDEVIKHVRNYQQIVNPANETGDSDLTIWLKSFRP